MWGEEKAEKYWVEFDKNVHRYTKSGGGPIEDAIRHVEFSDLPNVKTCLERSSGADLTLRMLPDGEYVYESGVFP